MKSEQLWQKARHSSRMAWLAVPAVALAMTVSVHAGSTDIQPQAKIGDPLPGLTEDQLERFFKGKTEFERTFDPEEGLGPVFNQDSCSSCHNMPLVGGSGTVTVTRFGKTDFQTGEFDPLEHLGGSLLQAEAIIIPGYPLDYCVETIPDEANEIASRVTNSSIGLGLVEAIPEDDIIALANKDHPSGVDGKIHWVPLIEDPEAPLAIGRMGWKSQIATVMSFSADASLMEMGITSKFLPDPVAPNANEELMEVCDSLGPPHPQEPIDDEGVSFTERITDFQRFLAPPPQTPRSGMTGEALFNQIGCAECHVRTFVTADSRDLEDVLRNQEIHPYSDFLLHDMGILGDGIEQGDAGQREFRTPSLWGLRWRDPILHDGRASGTTFEETVLQAIEWHDVPLSTARPAAQAFFDLKQDDQDLVIAFLDSLGRAEFDFTGNNAVGDSDFQALIGCYSGPDESYAQPSKDDPDPNPMDDPCAVFDINQDGHIDHIDFEVFVTVYEGDLDFCELWTQLAAGVDDGIDVPVPDECLKPGPDCPGDLTGDGTVGVPDLLVLIGEWGTCPGSGDCPADLTGDGSVGVPDLLILINNWGACPE